MIFITLKNKEEINENKMFLLNIKSISKFDDEAKKKKWIKRKNGVEFCHVSVILLKQNNMKYFFFSLHSHFKNQWIYFYIDCIFFFLSSVVRFIFWFVIDSMDSTSQVDWSVFAKNNTIFFQKFFSLISIVGIEKCVRIKKLVKRNH